MATRDLVTGAFGYTGSRIARRSLAEGREVVTLTRRDPPTHPLAGKVRRLAYDFSPQALESAMAGVDTLYVTYWMRFPRGGQTWPEMVDNVDRLARAAVAAGVRRFVYISVSNARPDSSTAYFRAKAAAEQRIRQAFEGAAASSYAIVRPTLLYGESDILINNMAWTLRRLPVFGIPGDGRYRVQPVYVEDVADLCVALGRADEAAEVTAAGPETLAFDELVALVRATVNSRALVLRMPTSVVLATTWAIGLAVRDVVLTRDEIRELTESLLASDDARGTCPTRLSGWLAGNAATIGRRYSSELARNFRV